MYYMVFSFIIIIVIIILSLDHIIVSFVLHLLASNAVTLNTLFHVEATSK